MHQRQGRDEAQSALIHAVLAKLAENQTLSQEAKDLVKRLKDGASVLKLAKFIGKTAVTMTPDLGGFIDCFREESEKIAETMESFEKDFEKLLERGEIERVVVFIDDLDRCSSAKVIETFETIKLFLNTPKCTFVIGADPDRIEDAVGDVYGVGDGRRRKDYLEKIVQIPFNIPEQALKDIGCYVGMLVIGRHMAESGWRDLLAARSSFYDSASGLEQAIRHWLTSHRILFGDDFNDLVEELNAILPFTENLARGLRGNPRQIKRFLNIMAVRRKLAKENGQDVKPDLLVKLGVLEYVWEDFFNLVVETVDPSTGHSQLIEEVVRGIEEGDASSDSQLVTDALAQAGLVSYLSIEPHLSGKIDLRPYLFLAQTSLSRGRASAIAPVDEEARGLVSSIASEDRLRSRAAAKRAASKEAAVVAPVVRLLLKDLPVAKEASIRTNVITALEEICRKHPSHFGPAMKAIEGLDPSEEAVALAATSFLAAAEKAEIQVPTELTDKFRKSSKLVEALAVPKRSGRRVGLGGP